MLVRFRFENHRSLRDEQELSLVAAAGKESSADPRLLRPAGFSAPILPAVAIYGPNASGKSNVLDALAFMQEAIVFGHQRWQPDDDIPLAPFAMSAKPDAPSLFETDIIAHGTHYRYGFVAGKRAIEEEWLFAWPHRRKQVWYEREGGEYRFNRNLKGPNDTIRSLTRDNSLFLSAAAQNNHQALLPVFDWFVRLQLAGLARRPVETRQRISRFLSRRLRDSPSNVVGLLRGADTGIIDVKVTSGAAGGRYGVLFLHRGADGTNAWLPLEDQSAGTLAFIDIGTRMVDALLHGAAMCVDELERSLHPVLALEVLGLFNNLAKNKMGAQLIFTTHDTNMLGNVVGGDALRRDQIWFTEKDEGGATLLYPLTDFHPRKLENLERGYLQGRYGAFPIIGELAPEHDDGKGGI